MYCEAVGKTRRMHTLIPHLSHSLASPLAKAEAVLCSGKLGWFLLVSAFELRLRFVLLLLSYLRRMVFESRWRRYVASGFKLLRNTPSNFRIQDTAPISHSSSCCGRFDGENGEVSLL